MKKIFSALTMAVAGLISQVSNASQADWANDPDIVYSGSFPHESCIRGADGKPEKLVYNMEVLSMKPSWDKATTGKSDAEKTALQKKLIDISHQALDTEWRTRAATLTIADVENMTDAYAAATDAAFNKIPEIIEKETGVEVMVGSDRPPMVYPGCDLK